MGTMESRITSITNVYSTVYSGVDQRKHQSSVSLVVTGEFPGQGPSNAENIFIWWRHHDLLLHISRDGQIFGFTDTHILYVGHLV